VAVRLEGNHILRERQYIELVVLFGGLEFLLGGVHYGVEHLHHRAHLGFRHNVFSRVKDPAERYDLEISHGREAELGLGEAVGRMISDSSFPHKDLSLLSVAYRLNIPVTVHVAIGTDTIHFHPNADGGAIGETSLRDFYLFCSLLEDLEGGGVYINAGSAVLLPEVFLKGVSLLRNRGVILEDFTTAVFDFMMHYRPFQNVVKRPLGKNGRGFYFIGHHEIMIPLLAASLRSLPSNK